MRFSRREAADPNIPEHFHTFFSLALISMLSEELISQPALIAALTSNNGGKSNETTPDQTFAEDECLPPVPVHPNSYSVGVTGR